MSDSSEARSHDARDGEPPVNRGPAADAPRVVARAGDGPPTVQDVVRWLRLFVPPGQVTEARFLRAVDNPKYPAFTVSGFFDHEHLDQMAATVGHWSPRSEGSYFIFNPVDPELLSLARNRLVRKPEGTTEDKHILGRVRIVVDADPVRRSSSTGEPLPPRIPSSDAEKALALDRIGEVAAHLEEEHDWPAPTLCDSGNGYHAWWSVDLPRDDDDLVKRVLAALDGRFSDDRVKIDRSLSNPARLIKIYGSLARKGENTPARPHRFARVLDVPDGVLVVARGQLEAVAAAGPAPVTIPRSPATSTRAPGRAGVMAGDLSVEDRADRYLAKCDPSIAGEKGHNKAFKAACKVGPGFDLAEDVALRLLLEHFNPRCVPEWSERELAHKVSEAYTNEPRRGWLLDGPRNDRPPNERDGQVKGGGAGDASASKRPGPTPAEDFPTLAEGTRVKALDRDNIGHVVADLGARASVHFVSPSGREATVTLPKSKLAHPDGRPLTVAAPPADGEWPAPKLDTIPPAVPFPDVVLPDPVADFVRAVARAIGCPVDFVALPALVVAGATIGRSASLLLKPGYFVQPALYGMNVGGPSSGKSPALDAAARPTWDHDERLHDEYRREREAFEEAEEIRARAPKGDKPVRPARPVLRSAVLDDTTAEAVAPHLAANPRGLLVSRDEGSAWVAGLNQYKNGKGSDRQFWLSALFGKPVRVDRKGHADMEPIRVPHPFLAVVGNLTPDMLGGLREAQGRSDGFVERILFAFPEPLPKPHWSDEGIPDEARRDWAGVVDRLRARPMAMSDEGRPCPHVARFAPEAKAAWVEWYDRNVDEVNSPGFDAGELAVEGKLQDFAARLALILHLLHLACDPTTDDLGPIPPVSRWAVSGAIALWGYFRAHHRRARWFMNGGVESPSARAVLDWVKRNGREEFSVKELLDNLRWLRDRPNEPETTLRWLEERHLIRRQPDPERPAGTRGQKPSPTYEVHPSICDPISSNTGSQNSQNSRNSVGEGSEDQFCEFCEFCEAGPGENQDPPPPDDEETTWVF